MKYKELDKKWQSTARTMFLNVLNQKEISKAIENGNPYVRHTMKSQLFKDTLQNAEFEHYIDENGNSRLRLLQESV